MGSFVIGKAWLQMCKSHESYSKSGRRFGFRSFHQKPSSGIYWRSKQDLDWDQSLLLQLHASDQKQNSQTIQSHSETIDNTKPPKRVKLSHNGTDDLMHRIECLKRGHQKRYWRAHNINFTLEHSDFIDLYDTSSVSSLQRESDNTVRVQILISINESQEEGRSYVRRSKWGYRNDRPGMMKFPQFSDACKSTCKSKSDCEDCDCGTTFAVPICFFDLCECVDAKRGLLSPSPSNEDMINGAD
ncbi:hypothetical protein Tco_1264073 [Tanacetum coccineum]